MSCGGNNNSNADAIAAQNAQQQANVNTAVGNINDAFASFTPQFYQGVGTAYQNYAMPQLQQQYQTNANNLGFKLAGQGLSNGSAAQAAGNSLANTMSQAQTQLGNQAVSQENQLQSQVANEKANLIAQAQTSQDPSSTNAAALAQAQASAAPSTFAPIGQMFNQFASQYLGSQNANLYNNYANQYLTQTNNPGLFSLLGQGYAGAIPGATQQ